MSKNPSALKRNQIAARNGLRNKRYKSSVKTIIRKTLESIANLDKENSNISQVNLYMSESYSKIDKAVNKRIIPKNQGARRKSMLSRRLKRVIVS